MLHSDSVPADSFGRPFYNRTLHVGPPLTVVGGLDAADAVAAAEMAFVGPLAARVQ